MARRRLPLILAGLVLVLLVVPALSSADENPIDRSEYGHLSGGLTHLFAAGGGVGGGSLTNLTCTSSGDPTANVYVRLVRESDASEVHGGWTTTGGLFVIASLPPARYRLEVAFAASSGALASQSIDVAVQSYVAVYAPLP